MSKPDHITCPRGGEHAVVLTEVELPDPHGLAIAYKRIPRCWKCGVDIGVPEYDV